MSTFFMAHMDKVVSAILGFIIFTTFRYAPRTIPFFKQALAYINPVTILLSISGLCAMGMFTIVAIVFHMDKRKEAMYDQYIVAAYNANNAKKAKQYWNQAMAFVDDSNWKEGFTSLWYDSPQDSVADWYDHIKDVRSKMDALTDSRTEDVGAPWRTIMANSKIVSPWFSKTEKTVKVNTPKRLAFHPYNKQIFNVEIGFCLGFLVLLIAAGIMMHDYY